MNSKKHVYVGKIPADTLYCKLQKHLAKGVLLIEKQHFVNYSIFLYRTLLFVLFFFLESTL